VALGYLASSTSLQYILNILAHSWPIVVLFQHEKSFVLPKVTRQGSSMNLPNEQLFSPTLRDAKPRTLEEKPILNQEIFLWVPFTILVGLSKFIIIFIKGLQMFKPKEACIMLE